MHGFYIFCFNHVIKERNKSYCTIHFKKILNNDLSFDIFFFMTFLFEQQMVFLTQFLSQCQAKYSQHQVRI